MHGFANNFAPLLTQVEPTDILDLDSGRAMAIVSTATAD
jgi:hypothetical protein